MEPIILPLLLTIAKIRLIFASIVLATLPVRSAYPGESSFFRGYAIR